MSEPSLVVCSHRGPVSFRRVRGNLHPDRGGGGLIGALAPVLQRFGGTWIASALTEADADLGRTEPNGRPIDGYTLRFLDLPRGPHREHYDVVSNEHLWFVFHYLFHLPFEPRFGEDFRRAWEGYRTINRIYGEAVARTTDADAVLVQDYHLMTVAEDVRRRRRRTGPPLLYFHHVPWSEPDYFGMLPAAVIDELLRGMLAYDVVGFQATRWAHAFLRCCDRFVQGAIVGEDRVAWKGRMTRVVVAPAPLDVPRVQERSTSVPVESWRERLDALRAGRKTLLRVDRVELSKNVLRGFLAYESLLERRPDLSTDAWFLALLYPSRPRVTEYRRYLGACLAAAQRINERFPGAVGLYVQDDYHRSLAGMRLADALLVNPVFDGLNLVAKEGVVSGERDPALVLSRNAGVFEELGEAAVAINPFDVSDTAEGIERAFDMPDADRARRAAKLRRIVSTGTPEGWVRGQLEAADVRV